MIEEIVLSLSIHGKAHRNLRDRITRVYRELIETRPEMAPRFVQDLIAWRRWDFVDEYREIERSLDPDDPLAGYAVNLYLGTASRSKNRLLN